MVSPSSSWSYLKPVITSRSVLSSWPPWGLRAQLGESGFLAGNSNKCPLGLLLWGIPRCGLYVTLRDWATTTLSPLPVGQWGISVMGRSELRLKSEAAAPGLCWRPPLPTLPAPAACFLLPPLLQPAGAIPLSSRLSTPPGPL